jgi:hypothetical protein
MPVVARGVRIERWEEKKAAGLGRGQGRVELEDHISHGVVDIES